MPCSNELRPMSCQEAYEEMVELLQSKSCSSITANSNKPKPTHLRNYSCRIQMDRSSYAIETDLFPLRALQVYSAYNLGDTIRQQDKERYFSAHRGGSQGDYRKDMMKKIDNVIDCLVKFPRSKRASITVPNTSLPSHSSDDDAKCMREIHFYLDEEYGDGTTDDCCSGAKLNATVWMRAQAAEIFPKNIHFIGSLMERVAAGVNKRTQMEHGGDDNDGRSQIEVGELFYLATTLVSVRED